MDLKELRRIRKEKGLTQPQVAVAIGVSVYTYQLWEKGVTTPKPENMQKLKQVLGG